VVHSTTGRGHIDYMPRLSTYKNKIAWRDLATCVVRSPLRVVMAIRSRGRGAFLIPWASWLAIVKDCMAPGGSAMHLLTIVKHCTVPDGSAMHSLTIVKDCMTPGRSTMHSLTIVLVSL
jgi:hypothetical protein